MREHEAVRQLVKSPPELWTQCSDAQLLSRHLNGFGEITITRLEPESTVAWEGESARGTVTLEAAGWGTRVRLTATPPDVAATPPAAGAAPSVRLPVVPEPDAVSAPRGLAARLGSILGVGLGLGLRRAAPDGSVAAAGSADGPATPPGAQPPDTQTPDAWTRDARTPDARTRDTRTPDARTPDAPADLRAELEAALDSLGQAHHRPYSRS
jgi:hypothetical protein